MHDFIVPVSIFAGFYFIIKVLSDNHLRRKLIEKNMVNENVRFLFQEKVEMYLPASLKWGMVLISLGSAILIGQFVPRSYQDEITVALLLLFAGLALVIYYLIGIRLFKTTPKS
ncbi:hypothetical protein L0128_19550 [candidate division KSB1 bacterium]|nr:hypothetical protein [candidate division KSB1 bacterium]